MKVFTREGAKRLGEEFDKLCEEFAKRHDINFEKRNLTYGEGLTISAKFSIKENTEEAWDNFVRYFAREYDVVLQKGLIFSDSKGTRYQISGKTNPSRTSKFKIGTDNLKNGSSSYWTVDALAQLLKKQGE